MADQARRAGNAGMVRVCARRAAGIAIRVWRMTHPRPSWGNDAVTQLRGLSADASTPAHIRRAASRLAARASADRPSPPANETLGDADAIVTHLLGPGTSAGRSGAART
jgi:hypothetical protein